MRSEQRCVTDICSLLRKQVIALLLRLLCRLLHLRGPQLHADHLAFWTAPAWTTEQECEAAVEIQAEPAASKGHARVQRHKRQGVQDPERPTQIDLVLNKT